MSDARLLAESEAAPWANLPPPRDYPEADDEMAHAAMVAERDALQARVKELENNLVNARRDIEYLKRKLEEAKP